MRWEIINTGVSSAEKNMQLDQKLLSELSSKEHCVLHLYDWERDSATYGYFTDPFKSLNKEKVQQLQLAKRSTGGGIIFHLWDYAFSLLVPKSHPSFSLNTLDNYAFINEIVAEAITNFTGGKVKTELLQAEPEPLNSACTCFCMAKPTQYDIVVNGRKVGGGAQRRTRFGFLHQGTISLMQPDYNYLETILLSKAHVIEAMKQNTFALLDIKKRELRGARGNIENELVKILISLEK